MAMRKWSIVEEELKNTIIGSDPRIMHALGEMHERHRVQHEQMMECVQAISQLHDKLIEVINAFGGVRSQLKRLGLDKKVTELEGNPDETGSTYHIMRDEPGKKN